MKIDSSGGVQLVFKLIRILLFVRYSLITVIWQFVCFLQMMILNLSIYIYILYYENHRHHQKQWNQHRQIYEHATINVRFDLGLHTMIVMDRRRVYDSWNLFPDYINIEFIENTLLYELDFVVWAFIITNSITLSYSLFE